MCRQRWVRIAASACFLLACAAWAQQQGSITTGGSSQRPIFLNGSVQLADGQIPPDRAEIELVCQGRAQPQGKTDSSGKFNIQLGANRFQGASDASVSSQATAGGFGGVLSGQGQVDGMSVMSLLGCTLRAALPGYRSESIDLSRVRLGESPLVGAIILHRLSNTEGVTVSSTSLSAPREARNALERARQEIAKGRLVGAENEINSALLLHPKYAEAWQELGVVLEAQRRLPEARKAYLEAAACDDNFTPPLLSLARMSATDKNWQEALERCAMLLRLNPYDYPQGYFYQAVAHYNLENNDAAFESARQAVKLDTSHSVPLAEQLLGVLSSMRGDFKAAAEHFRSDIRYAPPNANLSGVRALLEEAENRIKQSSP